MPHEFEQSVPDSRLGPIKDVIGKGIKFPFQFSEVTGSTVTSDGFDRINQSIFLILSTRPGERIFNPEFGSLLPTRIFEPLDDVLKQQIRLDILDSLERWEPRITQIRVGYVSTPEEEGRGLLKIAVEYKIRGTDISNVYVFPFQTQPQPGSDPFERR